MREHARRWLLCAVLAFVALVALPQAALAEAKPVWRLYNRYNGDHMWTLDKAEYDRLVKVGWTGEGRAWQAQARDYSSYQGWVMRLYNPWSGEHLFTMDDEEYDRLGKAGWRQEGAVFESAEAGAPVWRLYNKWLTAGTHLYTTNKAEYDRLVKLGWTGEGIRLCAELPESQLKQFTSYYIGPNSLVGGDGSRSGTLSTGVSASIRGDTLTLTPKGDRALLVKQPYCDCHRNGDPYGSENRTIINSAGELNGGKLSFRLTESTVYVVRYPVDPGFWFEVVGGREKLEKVDIKGISWPYEELIVDAQGNVVSLCLYRIDSLSKR